MPKAAKGVYAAAITPRTSDGSVDLEKLATYCQALVADGLTGVAPAGTTGEGNSLPMTDRLALPAVLADAGLPKDRVILGTGACAVEDAVRLTKASCDAGFKSVLVLPPFYFKNASVDGLYAYYAQLIERVGDTDLRVYLYHFPAMSATPIPIPLIARLKTDFGAVIAGLKDSSGDYQGTLNFVKAVDDFDVYPSTEAMLTQGPKDGCAGVISATVNANPKLVRHVLATGDALGQTALSELRNIIAQFPLSAALKQIQFWKSDDPNWIDTFAPLTPLNTDQSVNLRKALADFEDKYPDFKFLP